MSFITQSYNGVILLSRVKLNFLPTLQRFMNDLIVS